MYIILKHNLSHTSLTEQNKTNAFFHLSLISVKTKPFPYYYHIHIIHSPPTNALTSPTASLAIFFNNPLSSASLNLSQLSSPSLA